MKQEDKRAESENIELRSEEFQDVLGVVPPWILRWGITTIAGIVLILLVGSAVFNYPDIITSSLTLTGTTPQVALVARSSGSLHELYIQDNGRVTKGDYLAVIENPANTNDIFKLKAFLEQIDCKTDSLISPAPENLQLGNLQTSYTSFYLTLFEYLEYKRLQYLSSKTGIIAARIDQYNIQWENLIRQRELIAAQRSLSKNKYERDSLLNAKGILSDEELESTKGQYLQSVLSYENIQSSIDNNRMQIGQMQESLFEASYQDLEKKNALRSKLNTLVTQLQAEIQAWELSYMLSSPVNGKVTFTNFWVVNQNISVGEVIFNIIPEDSVLLLGKASLPIARSGKVATGQKVNIRFENFPDHEYGIVKGFVKNISLVPAQKGEMPCYAVDVELPDGLETSYGKTLPYLPEMTARADIITEDISLLERFIMPVRKVLTEGF